MKKYPFLPDENTKIQFNPIWPQSDSSSAYYTSLNRIPLKRKERCLITKGSWILDGQDREGAFIFALRRLYRALPADVAPKQLLGLPDYGTRTIVRDDETREPCTKVALEQEPRRRTLFSQVMFNDKVSLRESVGPRQLCQTVRDAIYGLLNAYRMGYVHREIVPQFIFAISRQEKPVKGYMLSKDGKSVEGEAREYSGFLFDFTLCYRLDGKDKGVTGDTEILERSVSTSTAWLEATKRDEICPSPIHDLESFLWVILAVATDTIIDFVSGKRCIRIGPDDEESEEEEESGEEDEGTEDEMPEDKAIDEEDAEVPIAKEATDAQVEAQSEGDTADAKEGNKAKDEDRMDTDGPQVREGESMPDDKMDEDVEDDEKIGSDDGETGNQGGHKRKRSDGSVKEMSEKAKGKMKATAVETEDEDEPNSDGASPNPFVEDEPASPKHIHFTFSHRSRYISIEEDPHARELRVLLEPRELDVLNMSLRATLLEKFDRLLAASVNLAPFRALLRELRTLAAEYHARWKSLLKNGPNSKFSRDEVEEAFARYLDAFEKHMPTEESWAYLVLIKVGHKVRFSADGGIVCSQ